jgi:DNA topoisomerase IA|tara:strand:- start:567 stop:809 length:243 start_codon:yes stop_codon:yes gene_type:complete
MVQAIITINEHEDRILNIVKGKYGLKNKSEAVRLVIDKFEEEFIEPELRPEYEKELLKVDRGKFKKFSSIAELRREIENV